MMKNWTERQKEKINILIMHSGEKVSISDRQNYREVITILIFLTLNYNFVNL